MIRSMTVWVCLYALVAGLIAYGVYRSALQTELEAAHEAGNVKLSEASTRLKLQIEGIRALANFAAQEPLMDEALRSGATLRVTEHLIWFRLTFGVWHIDLADRSGRIVASSGSNRVGQELSSGLIQAALNGRLGSERVVRDELRLFRFSRGVWAEASQPIGVIVVSIDMAALEFEWPLTPEPVVFFDTAQLSFSSNRPELLFSEMGSEDARFHLSSTPLSRSHGVWTLKTGTRTEEVLRLRKAIPQLDLTAELYLSTGPSRETARLRAGLALALAGVLGLIGAIILQQRRRLALESQHSATLEARVEARTNELQEAQSELIEASKLAALGRLSAGVSHELNQPLAAILNFAENGTQLVVRKRDEEAKGNFSMIADQVRRITRIIGNLRAFAREEVLPTDIVDLSAITEEVMAIVTEDLKSAGVTLDASLPGHPVPVLAGRVRLEQVLLNLFSNAIDAMQTSKRKTLSIKLRVENDNAHLTVRDTGAGIKDLDRVFEPFYSTKELGSSKGLGMGLALSYGIVTKFGGQISCQNTGDGAEFLLSLPLSEAL